ncbi:phenylalanine--tRNA ligase beta subunit-related protein, partial [Acinetobacter baumannii]
IESAYFDPVRTAQTGRKAGIQSDARYRFERGVDPASVMPGLDQATRMILDLCGGTPSKATVAGSPPVEPRTVAFNFARVQGLTGVALKDSE